MPSSLLGVGAAGAVGGAVGAVVVAVTNEVKTNPMRRSEGPRQDGKGTDSSNYSTFDWATCNFGVSYAL